MEEVLEESNQKLEQPTETEKSLSEAKEGLEVEVKRLRAKVPKAKNTGIAEFEKWSSYKFELKDITSLFLTNERIKIKRHLQRQFQIEDTSFMDNVKDKLTYADTKGDEIEEEGEEVIEDDPQKGQPSI